MILLLDVNVLIALGDANHPHRAAALHFFEKSATTEGWATCPISENAFLRILGGNGYRNGPKSTQAASKLLETILAAPGHQFWVDDISMLNKLYFPKLPASKHLTDLYLLALAVKRGGRFATFDQNIDPTLIPGGAAALTVIPTGD